MTETNWNIRPFEAGKHRESVRELYECVFGYEDPHNDPELVIGLKERSGDGLFFVAESPAEEVLGSVMAGYDGHRGWIYCLAVVPGLRQLGIGSALVSRAEESLAALGCVKINLQILEGNAEVEEFYHRLGFKTERRISMGKKLGPG